jgi:hypothetical protein
MSSRALPQPWSTTGTFRQCPACQSVQRAVVASPGTLVIIVLDPIRTPLDPLSSKSVFPPPRCDPILMHPG